MKKILKYLGLGVLGLAFLVFVKNLIFSEEEDGETKLKEELVETPVFQLKKDDIDDKLIVIDTGETTSIPNHLPDHVDYHDDQRLIEPELIEIPFNLGKNDPILHPKNNISDPNHSKILDQRCRVSKTDDDQMPFYSQILDQIHSKCPCNCKIDDNRLDRSFLTEFDCIGRSSKIPCSANKIADSFEPSFMSIFFLIDTSDSMQDHLNSSKLLLKNINHWIYLAIQRLSDLRKSSRKNSKDSNLKQQDFLVILQFSKFTIIEYADHLTYFDDHSHQSNRLARNLVKIEEALTNMKHQEKGSNTFQALFHLMNLFDEDKVEEEIGRMLERSPQKSLDSMNSKIDIAAWKKSLANPNQKKILYIVSDGDVRDHHNLEFYNSKLKNNNQALTNPNPNLLLQVGTIFDKINLIILNRDPNKIDPGLKMLAHFEKKFSLLSWKNPEKVRDAIVNLAGEIPNIDERPDVDYAKKKLEQKLLGIAANDTEVTVIFEKTLPEIDLVADPRIHQFLGNFIEQMFKNDDNLLENKLLLNIPAIDALNISSYKIFRSAYRNFDFSKRREKDKKESSKTDVTHVYDQILYSIGSNFQGKRSNRILIFFASFKNPKLIFKKQVINHPIFKAHPTTIVPMELDVDTTQNKNQKNIQNHRSGFHRKLQNFNFQQISQIKVFRQDEKEEEVNFNNDNLKVPKLALNWADFPSIGIFLQS